MSGRVLIADNVATNRIILKVKLAASRYQVFQAGDVASLAAQARQQAPDLIIMDLGLPGGGAAAALAALHKDPAAARIPVIVVTDDDSRAARLAALAAGATEVLVKPLDEEALLALVRNLIRARSVHEELHRKQVIARDFGLAEAGPDFTRPARIALVPQGPEAGFAWRAGLTAQLRDAITVIGKTEALDGAPADGLPDVYVIAATIARERDGLQLVSELRSRDDTRHAVLVVHNPSADPMITTLALDMGADTVLAGPFDAEDLALRLRRLIARKHESDSLRAAMERQLSLAMTDPLTGLYNRRYAQNYLARVIAQARDRHSPFTLMVLDLDRFKRVNDRYGHAVGDEVLVEVARRLRANLREVDLVARLGGEEFLVVLPDTGRTEAEHAAERLRRVIGERPVHVASRGVHVPVTMSIGVLVGAGDAQPTAPTDELLERADRALYASKSEGRNQVTFVRSAA